MGRAGSTYPTLCALLALLRMARLAVGAIRHLGRAVPRTFGLCACLHGAMPGAHGHRKRSGVLFRRLHREALQQRRQPGQQALLITISQGYLHCATCQGNVDIGTGRSLWQCRRCLTLRLSLGLLGWLLAGVMLRIFKLIEPLLHQLMCTPGNGSTEPMLTELIWCLVEIAA